MKHTEKQELKREFFDFFVPCFSSGFIYTFKNFFLRWKHFSSEHKTCLYTANTVTNTSYQCNTNTSFLPNK